jgi:hypothetical protein
VPLIRALSRYGADAKPCSASWWKLPVPNRWKLKCDGMPCERWERCERPGPTRSPRCSRC